MDSPQPTGRMAPRGLLKHRRLVAIGFSLFLCAVVLGLFEAGLRLAGLGGYPQTFRVAGTLEDGSTLVLTDAAGPASYFFANRSEGMALDPSALRVPKPDGTVRVMLVGESAAKGIPQPRPLRASAFLQAMLTDLWPDRTVEVLNLGTPGIASYPVLGVMTEALQYEPDLVIVYLGNNEFYGAFGVASLHTAGRSPAVIRLLRAFHSTAVAQGITHLMGQRAPGRSNTLMEAMVGQSCIGPRDSARAAAARTLETFVGEMIERCRRSGVPVVVCTPPCNERDMAPLGEPSLAHLPTESRERLDGLLQEARERLERAPVEAESAARAALAIEGEHALARYLLARALSLQGREEEARAEFRQAIDLDTMPWRPPASSVSAIRRAVESRNAVLADLERAFQADSPGGSIGWELMEDHVHPTLRGQERVARTILRAMTALPESVRVDEDRLESLPDWQAYAERLGANPYEAYAVAYRMTLLGQISFFLRSTPDMRDRNAAICRELEERFPPPVIAAIREWADPRTDRIDRYPISAVVGRALLQMGKPAEAVPLFRFAEAAADPYGSWSIEFAYSALLAKAQAAGTLGEPERAEALRAIRVGEFLIESGHSRTGGAELWVGRLHQLRGDVAASIPFLLAARDKLPGRNRAAADDALVRAYLRTGQVAEARTVIEEGLRGPFPEEYRGMGAR